MCSRRHKGEETLVFTMVVQIWKLQRFRHIEGENKHAGRIEEEGKKVIWIKMHDNRMTSGKVSTGNKEDYPEDIFSMISEC